MTPMATKVSYSTGRAPRYGVVSQPKQSTYTTLAQPASTPINPLYRAMAATSGAAGAPDALGRVLGNGQNVFPSVAPNTGYFNLNPVAHTPTAPAATPDSNAGGGGTGGNGGTGGGAGGTTFDMSSDPILAQIKTLGDKSIGDAQTSALTLKKQALIRSGFGDLAQTLLGDTNTAEAAKQNPTSTLAQILQAHRDRQNQIDLATNANNTFYGSAHANALGDESKQLTLDQSNAQNALYDLLNQADQGVLAARNHAQDQYIGELPNAYGRFIAQPGAGGGAGGGAGAAGGGSDGTGGAGTGDTSGAGGLTGSPAPMSAAQRSALALLALGLTPNPPRNGPRIAA